MESAIFTRMRGLLCFLTIFLVFAGFAQAQTSTAIGQDSTRPFLTGNPVVAVESAMSGTGVYVLLDKTPAILTNSHILKGRKTATVWLSETISVAANVVFDSPADDFVFLRLASPWDERLAPIHWAAGAFCTNESLKDLAVPCMEALFTTATVTPDDHVDFADGLKSRTVLFQAPYKSVRMTDMYINGRLDGVAVLPIFLRPGASGGAFFEHGIFSGLLTDVSASGESFAIAIPEVVIHNVLQNGPTRPARWVCDKSQACYLEIKDGTHVLRMSEGSPRFSVAGGETSHGGGETSHGGGETSHGGGETSHGGGETSHGGADANPRFWKMDIRVFDVPFYAANKKYAERLERIETLNPFLPQSSVLEVDGAKSSVLEITNDKLNHDSLYVAATVPLYMWAVSELPKHQKEKRMDLVLLPANDATREKIELLRAANSRPVKYARLYTKTDATHFTLVNQNCDTTGGNGAEALFPEYDQVKSLKLYADHACAKNKARMHGRLAKGFPFSSQKAPNTIVDTWFNDPQGRTERVTIGTNLSTINVGDDVLVRLESIALSSVAYQSKKTGLRAIAVFDTANLLNLQRIYIETPNNLAELVTCSLEDGCYR